MASKDKLNDTNDLNNYEERAETSLQPVTKKTKKNNDFQSIKKELSEIKLLLAMQTEKLDELLKWNKIDNEITWTPITTEEELQNITSQMENNSDYTNKVKTFLRKFGGNAGVKLESIFSEKLLVHYNLGGQYGKKDITKEKLYNLLYLPIKLSVGFTIEKCKTAAAAEIRGIKNRIAHRESYVSKRKRLSESSDDENGQTAKRNIPFERSMLQKKQPTDTRSSVVQIQQPSTKNLLGRRPNTQIISNQQKHAGKKTSRVPSSENESVTYRTSQEICNYQDGFEEDDAPQVLAQPKTKNSNNFLFEGLPQPKKRPTGTRSDVLQIQQPISKFLVGCQPIKRIISKQQNLTTTGKIMSTVPPPHDESVTYQTSQEMRSYQDEFKENNVPQGPQVLAQPKTKHLNKSSLEELFQQKQLPTDTRSSIVQIQQPSSKNLLGRRPIKQLISNQQKHATATKKMSKIPSSDDESVSYRTSQAICNDQDGFEDDVPQVLNQYKHTNLNWSLFEESQQKQLPTGTRSSIVQIQQPTKNLLSLRPIPQQMTSNQQNQITGQKLSTISSSEDDSDSYREIISQEIVYYQDGYEENNIPQTQSPVDGHRQLHFH